MIAEPAGRELLEQHRVRIGGLRHATSLLELFAALRHGQATDAGREPPSCALQASLEDQYLDACATQKQCGGGSWRAAAYHDHSVVFHLSIVYHGMT